MTVLFRFDAKLPSCKVLSLSIATWLIGESPSQVLTQRCTPTAA
jgi:hypothetical protein